MLLEVVGNVDSKHLGPQIAVIAGSIAPTPHVVEVGSGIARRNLHVEQPHVVELFLLESASHVRRRHLVGSNLVPCKVEAGRGKILAQGVGSLEVDALKHALLKISRHRLASLSMTRKVVEHLGNRGKRLVELRRHLDKVARYGCARQCIVLAVGEDAMESMSKLMEHCAHLVPGDERGLTLRSLSIVAHIIYNR